MVNKSVRSNAHWFEKYPWVDYDVEEVSLTFDFYK